MSKNFWYEMLLNLVLVGIVISLIFQDGASSNRMCIYIFSSIAIAQIVNTLVRHKVCKRP